MDHYDDYSLAKAGSEAPAASLDNTIQALTGTLVSRNSHVASGCVEAESPLSHPAPRLMDTGENSSIHDDIFASRSMPQNPQNSQQAQELSRVGASACPVANSDSLLPSHETQVASCSLVEVMSFTNCPSRPEEAGEVKLSRKKRQRSAFRLDRRQAVKAISATAPANIGVPTFCWRRLSERDKFQTAAEFCQTEGSGLAVSLNLGVTREQLYTEGQTKTSITRLFQNALNRALKEAGQAGLEYALVFELSPEGRLHLHGIVRGATLNSSEIRSIKRAFCNAAGKTKGKAAARQVQFKNLYDARGWTRYTWKSKRSTSKTLGCARLMIMSRSMARLTRTIHEEFRDLRQAA